MFIVKDQLCKGRLSNAFYTHNWNHSETLVICKQPFYHCMYIISEAGEIRFLRRWLWWDSHGGLCVPTLTLSTEFCWPMHREVLDLSIYFVHLQFLCCISLSSSFLPSAIILHTSSLSFLVKYSCSFFLRGKEQKHILIIIKRCGFFFSIRTSI